MIRNHSPHKRSVNGILLLDKPVGITSNQALQKVKGLFMARKAGHTGSLDPLASGMLPVCLGEATKMSQFLLTSDKRYQVTARLGLRTATGDAEGEIIAQRTVPDLDMRQLNKVFDAFRGEIQQVPSMYSALKHQGKPLYHLARQGISVPRESRHLTIYQLDLLHVEGDLIQFELHCSKGTYVRTLVDDFGEILQCGAHVIALRRLSVGAYHADQMISLQSLQTASQMDSLEVLDRYLLPIHSAVAHWPELRLTESTVFYLKQGSAVMVPQAPSSGWVRLADKQGHFLGVGEVLDDGKIAPRRLLNS